MKILCDLVILTAAKARDRLLRVEILVSESEKDVVKVFGP